MMQELLTQREYDQHMAAGTLRLAFIGMSNVGKSYRASVLQDQCGFFWYRVDSEILRLLGFKSEDEIATQKLILLTHTGRTSPSIRPEV